MSSQGGIISIATCGSKDLILTSCPEITFFKVVYRRYTNFAIDSCALKIDNPSFGKESTVKIPYAGDLLQSMYLSLKLPNVFYKTSQTLPSILNASLSTASDNYNIVKNFMRLNMQVCRIITNNVSVVNVTP